MKNIFTLLVLFTVTVGFSQNKAFGDGESFKFRVHYGFVTAGYATLKVKKKKLNGKEVYHIKGRFIIYMVRSVIYKGGLSYTREVYHIQGAVCHIQGAVCHMQICREVYRIQGVYPGIALLRRCHRKVRLNCLSASNQGRGG